MTLWIQPGQILVMLRNFDTFLVIKYRSVVVCVWCSDDGCTSTTNYSYQAISYEVIATFLILSYTDHNETTATSRDR